MKKSYIKIITFEIISFFLLVISSFKSDILTIYKTPFLLLILSFIFLMMLGIEKTDKRYEKDIIFEIVRFMTIFLLLYYLSGILITFARVPNYLNLYGLTKIIIPIVLYIIFNEILRYLIITKCGENKFLIFTTFLFFVGIDILDAFIMIDEKNLFSIFLFVSENVLPAISTNVLLLYISKKFGFKPAIIYLMFSNLYAYFIPIIPNPSRYLKSIIDFVIPLLLFLRILKLMKKPYNVVLDSRSINKKNRFRYIIPLLLTSIVVYFVSGYFKYYSIAVASGSMVPVFDRGDVVIIEKISPKYNNIKNISEGDIVAFRNKSNIIIIHRIVKIINYDGTLYIYTKGDANNTVDDSYIEVKDILGIVRFKLPYLGYPTVLLSEL